MSPLFDEERGSIVEFWDRRGVNDIIHAVAAVGSRSVEKAQEFINQHAGGDKSVKAYASYQEVFDDKVCPGLLLCSRVFR